MHLIQRKEPPSTLQNSTAAIHGVAGGTAEAIRASVR